MTSPVTNWKADVLAMTYRVFGGRIDAVESTGKDGVTRSVSRDELTVRITRAGQPSTEPELFS